MLQDAGRVLCRFVLLVAGKEGKGQTAVSLCAPSFVGLKDDGCCSLFWQ